jgi:lysozyme
VARDVSALIAEAMPILVELCVQFEGVYLRPYLCPAGVPTVGVGTTRYLDGRAVLLTDPPITRETALVMLRHQLRATYIPGTLRACPAIDTPGRLAAIADLAYNIGVGALRASTLRRRIAADRWEDVPGELRRWNKAAGRTLPGLVRRREAEAALL